MSENKYIKKEDIFGKFNIQDRIALVTGASEGIGHDLSIALASAGATVIICSRKIDNLKKLETLIKENGGRAHSYSLDVTKVNEIEKLKEFIINQFGRLDILINSAAYTINALAWDTTESEWDKSVDTSFKGTFFCCTKLGEIMKDQGYGKIINLSSTYAKATQPTRSVYCGIKAGVCHLTEALAVEWGKYGIRINTLAPTAVKTPSRLEYLEKHGQGTIDRVPLGRIAETDDLIGAAIYLSSPASDFVTGHTLFVDGGFVAHG